MKVNIKRVDPTLPLPEYKTAGAVAFDFVTRETTIIPPRSVERVPGNVIVKTPKGYLLFVKDRSSTAKKGLICTAGIVDQDYCGENDEILVQVYNFQDQPVTVEKGDRIAQGIFVKIETAEWEEVTQMNNQDRGGFGTTG